MGTIFDFEIVRQWKKIMLEPVSFFSTLKIPVKDARADSTLFYLIVSFISLALVFIVEAITAAIRPEVISELNVFGVGTGWYSLFLLILLPIALLLSWVWLYIGSGIVHFFAGLFGAKKGYDVTFAVNAYSTAPSIFNVIPIVSWIAFAYSIALTIIGLREKQEMGTGSAVAAVFIPLVIVLGIIVALVLALVMKIMV